jgi:hypothetical protein
MKLTSTISLSIVVCLLALPSCVRYNGFVKCTFMSRELAFMSYDCKQVRPFMCTWPLYDYFRTVSLIDVLWLTEPVRLTYSDLYAQRTGLTCQEKKELIDKEFLELKKSIAFYVLITATDYDMIATPTNKLPPWSVHLAIDGKCYQPYHVKKVDLAPEYKYMFGECASRYRQAYHILFNARDEEYNSLITPATCTVALTVSSLRYRISCSWHATDNGWYSTCQRRERILL